MITLLQNKTPVETLSFPTTPVGKSSEIEFEMENQTRYQLTIKASCQDPDVIIVIPSRLRPHEKKQCKAVFQPAENRRSPLSATLDFEMVLE